MAPWPISLAAIELAEAQLGARFPEAYRMGMARSNGGLVEALGLGWWLAAFRDDTNRKRLARTWDDVVRRTDAARGIPGFPSGAVVIAEVDGNCLILVPDQLDQRTLRGEVWAWFLDGEPSMMVFATTEELMEARV